MKNKMLLWTLGLSVALVVAIYVVNPDVAVKVAGLLFWVFIISLIVRRVNKYRKEVNKYKKEVIRP